MGVGQATQAAARRAARKRKGTNRAQKGWVARGLVGLAAAQKAQVAGWVARRMVAWMRGVKMPRRVVGLESRVSPQPC